MNNDELKKKKMKNRDILYETLKRYLEYNFELTKAQGEFYAKAASRKRVVGGKGNET